MVVFALRRLRARLLATIALVVALAGAAALIGWSSLAAALAQEQNVRLRLGALAAPARSVQVVYFTLPGEPDVRAQPVASALRALAPAVGASRRVRIWHSIARNDPLGTRLVVAREPAADVVVRSGRLPRGCRAHVCEALALRGRAQLGERLRLGRAAAAVVV